MWKVQECLLGFDEENNYCKIPWSIANDKIKMMDTITHDLNMLIVYIEVSFTFIADKISS